MKGNPKKGKGKVKKGNKFIMKENPTERQEKEKYI